MPLVTDANGVASWVDDADLEAVLCTAAENMADMTAASGISPAAAHGTTSPRADVTTADALGAPTPAPPPLTLLQWCNMGFDADVAYALVDGRAVPGDLVPDPPRTFRAVMSSLGQWVGSATAAVTSLLARGSYDSMVHAASPSCAAAAQSTGAANNQKGGPLRGGSSQSMTQDGSDKTGSACTTMTRDGSDKTGSAFNTLTQDGSDKPGSACNITSVPPCDTAQQAERAERMRQMALLLALLPSGVIARVCEFKDDEWDKVPLDRRQAILSRHLGSYSAGTLSSCRRALTRLGRWLETNGFSKQRVLWECSGGLLSWFVQDEQEKSRSPSGGATVPAALRSGLVFAAKTLMLPLDVDAKAFVNVAQLPGRAPTPALATTIRMLYHFVHIAVHHERPVVRLYASGFVLAVVSALRLRDCQRATIQLRDKYLVGSCFTSKHPKRRQPLVMPFFAPLIPHSLLSGWWAALPQGSPVFGGGGPDFIFPRLSVPRGKHLDNNKVVRIPGPAKTADVIKAMRWILTIPPLSMDAATARRYSGHSLRHLLPTVARLLNFTIEERNEIARWAACADRPSQRNAMPNVYASEAECGTIIGILERLVARLYEVVEQMGGPASLPATGGWTQFAEAAKGPIVVAIPVVSDDEIDTQVGEEASSSESSDDDAIQDGDEW